MTGTPAYAALTHVGAVRAANEDAVVVPGVTVAGAADVVIEGGAPPASAHRPSAPGSGPLVFAVVDGMGGHRGGAEAASIVAGGLAGLTADDGGGRPEEPDGGPDVLLELVARGLCACNDELYATAARRPDLVGMGATAAGLVWAGGGLVAFSVGDARVCQFADGYALPVSRLDRTPDGYLTESLGGRAEPTGVEPWLRRYEATDASRWLVCTDGLWDHLPVARVQAVLEDEDRRSAAVTLRGEALEAGAPDNLALVIVDIVL